MVTKYSPHGRFIRYCLHQIHPPIWVKHPVNIQLDTQNYCNLDCVYCNVKASYGEPRGIMSLKTMKQVLAYWHGKYIWSVAPFMNGEPLLEKRLHCINTLIQSYGYDSIVDTNGSVYANRELLIHPNLKLIRFTISAATAETYTQVHGKPLFREALKTLFYVHRHKYPQQEIMIHFIECKKNHHELEQWKQLFRGFTRRIFSIHSSPLLKASEETKLKYHPPIIIHRNGAVEIEWLKKTLPCQCWDILGISWDGKILQCVDYPSRYNYGSVGETDLQKAWDERNRNKLDNPACRDCNVKAPNWKRIMDKYVR